MHSTKKSKLDFGAKLFGLPAEGHALPGQVDEGHALIGQIDEGHALPVANFGGKALQGHAQLAQLGANVKKNRSGPAYGRMGHVSILRFIVGAAVRGRRVHFVVKSFTKSYLRPGHSDLVCKKNVQKTSFVWKELIGIYYFPSKVIEFICCEK